MTQQKNILSFDEAKRTAVRARPSVSAAKMEEKKPKRRSVAKSSSPKGSSSKTETAKSRTASSRKSTSRPHVSQKASSKPSSAASAKESTKKRTVSSSAPRKKGTPEKQHQENSSRNIKKFSDIKRERTKKSAGKKFLKQFGGESSSNSSSSSSAGSRAAVYKGEMGRQHKRLTQKQAHPSSSSGKVRKFFSFSAKGFRSSRFMVSAVITACLFASGAFLYPTAQQYYSTMREHDRLEAEYEVVQQRNNVIHSEVEALSSAEGIEDRVRQEFGWVKEGQKAVTVQGVQGKQNSNDRSQDLSLDEVTLPTTWYSPMLDRVFGVTS